LSMLDEITVHEALLAQHSLAHCVADFLAKTGPTRDEGVKLTALAARVRRRRQIGEQGAIELAPREIGVDLGRIDADESRRVAVADEALRQVRGVETPDREHRLEAAARQKSLAIGADVFEKEI